MAESVKKLTKKEHIFVDLFIWLGFNIIQRRDKSKEFNIACKIIDDCIKSSQELKAKFESSFGVVELLNQWYLKGYLDARLDLLMSKAKRIERKTLYPVGFEYLKERK